MIPPNLHPIRLVAGKFRRQGDGEMGKWGNGEMGKWGNGEIQLIPQHPPQRARSDHPNTPTP